MDIERKRVTAAPGVSAARAYHHDHHKAAFADAYDDISQSDDVSEAVHAPLYRVREDRGYTCRGSDRLTVSQTFVKYSQKPKNSKISKMAPLPLTKFPNNSFRSCANAI